MASSEIILEAVSSVSQIPATEWDACANPISQPASLNGLDISSSTDPIAKSCTASISHYNPFVSHAFLSAVEASGSATVRTCCGPLHLLARLDGAIAGIGPRFPEPQSAGEYLFHRGLSGAYWRGLV